MGGLVPVPSTASSPASYFDVALKLPVFTNGLKSLHDAVGLGLCEELPNIVDKGRIWSYCQIAPI